MGKTQEAIYEYVLGSRRCSQSIVVYDEAIEPNGEAGAHRGWRTCPGDLGRWWQSGSPHSVPHSPPSGSTLTCIQPARG